MRALLLTIDLHLQGCHSLKEKRQRLKGFFERWGKVAQVAVCESDFHDSLQQAQWTLLLAGRQSAQVQQLLARLEDDLQLSVDAVISGQHQEWLV